MFARRLADRRVLLLLTDALRKEEHQHHAPNSIHTAHNDVNRIVSDEVFFIYTFAVKMQTNFINGKVKNINKSENETPRERHISKRAPYFAMLIL